MVCSLESGRMAVMARLLEAASISPNIAEDAVNKKLAAQYIYRELRWADDENLLDEEGDAYVLTNVSFVGHSI
ncbi:hypothetical protein F3Y22_tig00110895pilonHSYRG00583 [Hibiscus syriacus]|uniref:Uncharacterized protein n=1 Tax=Hibiscus syriacus TaxID=106335 RepID=A0A6A2ZFM6_HIBSY|nr:hypothetical protein F3Y22_tig00110895pilonHSYRG00583 [Hibiscus syriacus]